MDDNSLFLLLTLFGGLAAISAGLILCFFPPKRINWIYGYRTKSSSKSQEAWNFAQKYSGKNLILFGGLLALMSPFNLIIEFDEELGGYTGLILLLIFYAIPILRTELQLKKRFDNKIDN
jgi:uncharacterized membrane protein